MSKHVVTTNPAPAAAAPNVPSPSKTMTAASQQPVETPVVSAINPYVILAGIKQFRQDWRNVGDYAKAEAAEYIRDWIKRGDYLTPAAGTET